MCDEAKEMTRGTSVRLIDGTALVEWLEGLNDEE
jgi:hypothetical protein